MVSFDPKHLKHSLPSSLVPREIDDNLRYRNQLRSWIEKTLGKKNSPAHEVVWQACRRDVIFFANAFCWTLDSKRHPGNPSRPWITFQEFQDDLFYEMEESWGPPDSDDQVGFDRCWVKVRDVGVSHIPLIAAYRRFLCFTGQIFFLVSETADLVDDIRNPGAMMPKIDFIHSQMPEFMTEGVERHKQTYSHIGSNGKPDLAKGLIKGVACTDVATAGTRPTAIIADEFGIWHPRKSIGFLASSSGASNSRLFMGTPKGQGNGFHKVATETDIPRTDIHWTQHPWHKRGLYRSKGANGPIEYLDEKFWSKEQVSWLKKTFPLLAKRIKNAPADGLLRENYDFTRDGKIRSPYYDHECARSPFPWQIAQEHDLDFHGSGSPFYDAAMLQTYAIRNAMVPMRIGELSWDEFTFEPESFSDHESGKLFLWCNLTYQQGALGPAKGHVFQIGADVGAGAMASNSAISVWNCTTLCKVARYARRDMNASHFAEVAYAIGRWFGDANIIFEGAGHGMTFGDRLRELKYPNLFFMVDKKNKRKDKPGLFFEAAGKRSLLSAYGQALERGEAVCRDREALKEGLAFQLGEDSLVTHSDALNKANPAGAKRNHGDMWMADCLAWYKVKGWRKLDRTDVPAQSNVDEMERRLAEVDEQRFARSRW